MLRTMARLFVAFSVEDAARAQLLFQRTIPDFQPSAESFALAQKVFAEARSRLTSIGIADTPSFDLWTALIAGLAAQQLANDPAGDRWIRLIDRAVEMFGDFALKTPTKRR
jgi:hypothetical protein